MLQPMDTETPDSAAQNAADEPERVHLGVSITTEQRAAYAAAAAQDGRPISNWVRWVLDGASGLRPGVGGQTQAGEPGA